MKKIFHGIICSFLVLGSSLSAMQQGDHFNYEGQEYAYLGSQRPSNMGSNTQFIPSLGFWANKIIGPVRTETAKLSLGLGDILGDGLNLDQVRGNTLARGMAFGFSLLFSTNEDKSNDYNYVSLEVLAENIVTQGMLQNLPGLLERVLQTLVNEEQDVITRLYMNQIATGINFFITEKLRNSELTSVKEFVRAFGLNGKYVNRQVLVNALGTMSGIIERATGFGEIDRNQPFKIPSLFSSRREDRGSSDLQEVLNAMDQETQEAIIALSGQKNIELNVLLSEIAEGAKQTGVSIQCYAKLLC